MSSLVVLFFVGLTVFLVYVLPRVLWFEKGALGERELHKKIEGVKISTLVQTARIFWEKLAKAQAYWSKRCKFLSYIMVYGIKLPMKSHNKVTSAQ